MSRDALKSLDRIMDRLERRPQRGRAGISTAPLVFGIGLGLGNLMLTRLVPVVWSTLLPRGLEQAEALRGWPGVVWRLAVFCQARQEPVWVIIGTAAMLGLLVSYFVRPLRFLIWLSAIGVIAADAGILYVTLQTSLSATLSGAGF